ncbi:hypothetical protein FIA58_005190 [Flavobacterium jejuense]|uniref:Uncharacterized protein n=1 Tax=Flavobacterium jejuense TaxID=1544455 RepID=A0ABX0IN99_9FLAO|nr:hypothetical protein [Flavobacterium jejuense]NHN25068.1 hypothetical protein [Flavobacterium jejuense]
MNYNILALLLFFCFQTQAQEKQIEITTSKIEVNSKTQTIYIISGIASTITKEDLAFAKKYNIQYHDFGCLAPVNFKEYEIKNALVFEKLNLEFGIYWQKEIKSSSMGFEKWKKK